MFEGPTNSKWWGLLFLNLKGENRDVKKDYKLCRL